MLAQFKYRKACVISKGLLIETYFLQFLEQLKLLACFIKETEEGDGLPDLRENVCYLSLVIVRS